MTTVNLPETSKAFSQVVKDQKNIYYDMNYLNISDRYLPAQHVDRRVSPIIDCPACYKLSCVRMDLSVRDIPMMNTANNDFRVAMYYQPDNLTTELRLFANTTQPNRMIWNVSEIIESIGGLNETMEDAFEDIKVQYEAIHGPGTWPNILRPTNPPFMIYKQSDGFSLYADPECEDNNQEAIQIYFSNDLFKLFLGLPYNANKNLYGWDSPALKYPQWMKMFIKAEPGELNIVQVKNIPMIKVDQQYNSFSSWYQFNKIIMLSNSLGVRHSYYSAPDQSGKNVVYPVVTDFLINFDAHDNSPGSVLVYYPTAEYRILDLDSHTPLQNIDISLKVADVKGNVEDLMLMPGDHFSLKLLFTNSISH